MLTSYGICVTRPPDAEINLNTPREFGRGKGAQTSLDRHTGASSFERIL